jgi:diguanylate cyclase (GGDEF)-like protein
MKPANSIHSQGFRRSFMAVYALSAVLPVLVLIYFLFQYLFPALSQHHVRIDGLRDTISVVLVVMLLIPLLGLVLMGWWIRSLEGLTEDVKTKTAELMDHLPDSDQKNEMVSLRQHFDGLYNELQEKIGLLNQYSNRIIDDNIKLSEQAVKDVLTTLYNRRHFDERLDEETDRAKRHDAELSMILLDVDGFKEYNDTLGHQAGDSILHSMGLLIRSSIRRSDIPFRYGGDEFAVLLPDCCVDDAVKIAGKIIRTVAVQDLGNHKSVGLPRVSVSCGVAGFFINGEKLLADADRCLLKAKKTGKGRVVFATPRKKDAEVSE